MKWLRLLAFLLLLSAASCGKVGNPLPPIIRIPEAVGNLTAAQNGNSVVLTWTNPARYIDGNPVTDLTTVHVFRNGVEVGAVAAGPPGQPQSYSVEVGTGINEVQTFAVRIDSRSRRVTGLSNDAAIQPVDVPGAVGNLAGRADQAQIWLFWNPPQLNTALVESYIVRRGDGRSWTVTEPHHEDGEIESGQTYIYTVAAARGADARIPGPVSDPVPVLAEDKTPPQAPKGLTIDPASRAAGIGILSWSDNMERDLLGYKVYRSDRPDGGWELRTPMPVSASGFSDPDYVAGSYYQISAVDTFENESDRSETQRGP